MTTIKATCPTCGEVTLTPVDIDLRVDPHGVETSSYGFCCPHCTAQVRKPADERIVRLLVSGGVEALAPHQGSDEAAHHTAAPPLVPDDLLDFHKLLQRDDWFDHLLSVGSDRR